MKQKESRIRASIDEAEHLLCEGPHAQRARRDAETLLLHTLRETAQDINNNWMVAHGIMKDTNSAWLAAHGNTPILPRVKTRFKDYVERRRAGEPIQYITGETEFYGLPFRVTPDVLIPRPETEHLVEKALELVGKMQSSGAKAHIDLSTLTARLKSCPDTEHCLSSAFIAPRIVDVGTGSGTIAVALAHALPQVAITATDISARALAVARENAKLNEVSIRYLLGDLLAPVAGERFEFVVSNPPYVPEADRAALSVEVRDYEPALALFAGADGLEVYRRLIPAAFAALVPGGFVVLEIGFGQSPAIADLLAQTGFEQIEFIADLQGIPRVVCARRHGSRSS